MSLLPFDAVLLDGGKCRACEHEGPPNVTKRYDCLALGCSGYREHHLHLSCTRCGHTSFMKCSPLLTDQGEPR